MEITIIPTTKKDFEPIEVRIKIRTEKELDTLIQLMSIHKENEETMNKLKMHKSIK